MKQIGRRRKARRGLASTQHARVFLALACGAQHTTRQRGGERGRERGGGGEEFGLQWAKARKKGLLVIIKSSHTDFLPNLFPQGP